MHAALARMQPLAQRVALNYVVRYQVGRRGELIMLLENVWLFLTTTWKEQKGGCWGVEATSQWFSCKEVFK